MCVAEQGEEEVGASTASTKSWKEAKESRTGRNSLHAAPQEPTEVLLEMHGCLLTELTLGVDSVNIHQ